jgi:hypothetical protein
MSEPVARRRWVRLLSPLLFALALLLVLLEATVWRLLDWLGTKLERLSLFVALERLVARLSPGWVVAVFVIPFVPAVPLLKVLEFWMLAHHHYVGAVVLILGGKVVGAAFATRVYAIARPKMVQVLWFARAEAFMQRMLALGHAMVERIPMLAAIRQAVRQGVHAVRNATAARLSRLARMLEADGPGWIRRFVAARRRARRSRQQ